MEQVGTKLRRDAIGVWHIVFFVMAAAAPLAVVVGVTPYAFAFGNGTGVPMTFILVGLMYVLFSAGFTAMSAHIGGGVSFYPYIAAGLGKPLGVGGAFASIATYLSVELMATALFGVFANAIILGWTRVDVPWWLCCIALHLAVFATGRRSIEVSGRILAILMVAEVAILLMLGIAVLVSGGGPEGIALAPFGPASLTTGNLGVALVFIVSAFIGFEATAIFGEEAREPRRTIPRATFLAVSLIAVFYAFSTWIIALAYGPANIVAAANNDFTGLFQVQIEGHFGAAFGVVLQVLMITSLFACVLSFHNTVNRYFFVVSREGLLHRSLSNTHQEHQSPHVAGLIQLVLMAAILLALGFSAPDPVAIVGWASGFTAIGILIIQIMVSLSVIAFFRADRRETGLWRAMLAPAISAGLLSACLYLMVVNIQFVSGSDSPVVRSFPIIIAVLILSGVLFANWLRTARSATYENLGKILN
jgi:amino acid transporter